MNPDPDYRQLEVIYRLCLDWNMSDLTPQNLRALLRRLQTQLPGPGLAEIPLDENGQLAATTICVLIGGNREPWSAAAVWPHVIKLIEWLATMTECPAEDPIRRIIDCGRAYGLGVQRKLSSGPSGRLDGLWSGPEWWLREQIAKAVRSGLKLPAMLIPDFVEPNVPLPFEIETDLFNWLVQPALDVELGQEELIEFVNYGHELRIRTPFAVVIPILPGQRRTLLLRTGELQLRLPQNPKAAAKKQVYEAAWEQGQHVAIRLDDHSVGTLRKVLSEGGKASEFEIPDRSFAVASGAKHCSMKLFSCPCGRDTCQGRHRIQSFDPCRLSAKATLKSFIFSAIKGSLPNMPPKSFKEGMLYAWLAQGWSGGVQRLRQVQMLKRQMIVNPAGHGVEYQGAVDGLVLISPDIHYEIEKRFRCRRELPEAFVKAWRGSTEDLDCGCLSSDTDSACLFCAGQDFGAKPIEVWKYDGSFEDRELSVEDLQPYVPDRGLNPEDLAINNEDNTDWEGHENDDL